MLRVLSAVVCLVIVAFVTDIMNADEATKQVSKLLPANTVGVIRIEVNAVADPRVYETLAAGIRSQNDKAAFLNLFKQGSLRELSELQKAGALTLFVGVSMEPDISIVIQARDEDSAERIAKRQIEKSGEQNNYIVAHEGRFFSRIPKRNGRPEFGADARLFKSLNEHTDSPVVFALAFSSDHRRVLSELVAGADHKSVIVLKSLADLERAAMFIETKPKLQLGYDFLTENEQTAAQLAKALTELLHVGAEMKMAQERAPGFAKWAKSFKFKSKESRVIGVVDDTNALFNLAIAAISDTRRDAFRLQTMNDLKQFALAFHNYADHHKEFPTRAINDKDGKPLLSWRVSLLPYLDHQELYDKFHLDEPWDSPHNKKLILQMPPVFEPRQGAGADEIGKTPYVAPLGEKSLFSYKRALHFKDIVDGTSNTMLFMAAPKGKHVIWTKPDDLPIDYGKAESIIFGDRKELPFCMLDGSAHIWVRIGSDDNLRRLIQINDRELIKQQ